MYCKYCGKELPENSKFCPNCGKKLDVDVFRKDKIQLSLDFGKYSKRICFYILWFLLNIGLLISAKPGKHNGRMLSAEGFYPFDKSIGEVFQGKDFNFSPLWNIDVYDFSEFFFYAILLPFIILIFVKLIPSSYSSRISGIIKSINNKAVLFVREIFLFFSVIIKALYLFILKIYGPIKKTDNKSINVEKNVKSLNCIDDTSEDVEIEEKSIMSMPLFRRFIGSVIDKIAIVVLFVGCFILIDPFGSSGEIGTYLGILNVSPQSYRHIDAAKINTYFHPIKNEKISEYYTYRNNLEIEKNPPHIGYTKKLDIRITMWFVLFNLLYFIIFEYLWYASLGKRFLNGMLIDNGKRKRIGISKIMMRCLIRAMTFLIPILLLHFCIGMSYVYVILIYLLMEVVPVFFYNRSLIDICTGTKYIKRIHVERNQWRWLYGFLFVIIVFTILILLFIRFYIIVHGDYKDYRIQNAESEYKPEEQVFSSVESSEYVENQTMTTEQKLQNEINESNMVLPRVIDMNTMLTSIELNEDVVVYNYFVFGSMRPTIKRNKNIYISKIKMKGNNGFAGLVAMTGRSIEHVYENNSGVCGKFSINNNELKEILNQ